jgi:alpha-tubulin suppressor-like RCC1 family protein
MTINMVKLYQITYLRRVIVYKLIKLFIVITFFINVSPQSFGATTGTNVSGTLSYTTYWTPEGSPYNLTGDVTVIGQLYISPGTVVNGNGFKINAIVNAEGTSSQKIIFNNVKIQRGQYYDRGSYTTVGNSRLLLKMKYCEFNNGSILPPSTNGFLDITDSIILNSSIESRFILENLNNSFIERNQFIKTYGKMAFDLDDASSSKFLIKNNLFHRNSSYFQILSGSPYNSSWADITIEGNSFLNTNSKNIDIYSLSKDTKLTINNNYWNTTDINIIKTMVDKLPDYIPITPILNTPNELTPKLNTIGIAKTVPDNSSQNTPTSNPTLEVSFIENMNAGTEYNHIRLYKNDVNVDITTKILNNQLFIQPVNRLDFEADYYVELPIGALQNENGEPSEGHRFNFKTKPQLVQANPIGGIYNQVKDVSLILTAPSTIYYTTDGSNPKENGITYSSPVKVDRNTTLTFAAKNENGEWSESYTENYIIDLEPPLPPTVNAIGDSDTKISGEAEIGSKIIIKINDQTIGTTTADQNGYFSMNILPNAAGTEINVIAIDNAGNTNETLIVVVDNTPPQKPIVYPISDKSNTVSGKSEIGSIIIIADESTQIGETQANGQGEFSLNMDPLPAGKALNVTAIDSTGNKSQTEYANIFKTMDEKSNVNKIDGGQYHTVALRSDGSIWTWGYNNQSQAGDGSQLDKHLPYKTQLENMKDITSGYQHTVAIDKEGFVWTWGSNTYGQIGDGTTTNRITPYKINEINDIVSIAAGKYHTIALKDDGTVWQWGWDTVNQVNKSPILINGLENIIAISASGNHSIALKNDGTVLTWGYNNSGQLGNGSFTNSSSPVFVRYQNPTTNQFELLKDIIKIDAGDWHSIALKNDGTVFIWGYNGYGVLGVGTSSNKNTATKVNSITNAIDIAAGFEHSVALKDDGTVWTWGDNKYGQLGDGTLYRKTYPIKVAGLPDIVSISAGACFTLTLDNRGTPWVWGENKYGALGIGNTYQRTTAVRVLEIFPELQEAIKEIDSLPQLLSYGDKEKINSARQKVNVAKEKGALDSEITNLNKLLDSELKLLEIANSYKHLVQTDKTNLQIGFKNGDSISNITQNILLLSEGENETLITWNSSKPQIISENGTVTRPSYGSGDIEVELIAIISKEDIKETKKFNVIVKELPNNLKSRGFIESPQQGQTIQDIINISGWFLDGSGIKKIEVIVDNIVLGEADYGLLRKDVAIAYPEYNNNYSGFKYSLNTSILPEGIHTLVIKGYNNQGLATALSERTFFVTHELTNKGFIDSPQKYQTISGKYNVSGWLLDASGISKIEVVVDGSVIGEAVYGHARFDVANVYPNYNNNYSGYKYLLDTYILSEGQHTLVIRGYNNKGEKINLTARNFNVTHTLPAKGYLESLKQNQTIKGNHDISGWLLEGNGVKKIEIIIDGSIIGEASYGLHRPDVALVYPDYKNSNSGFSYSLDANSLIEGQHTLVIRGYNNEGEQVTFAERTFIVSHLLPAKGYLDSIKENQTISGNYTISGWALDGSGVSKIEVLIDNSIVGEATYGFSRSDVLAVFPEYNNSMAGYRYFLNTMSLSEGKHTITIRHYNSMGVAIFNSIVNFHVTHSLY